MTKIALIAALCAAVAATPASAFETSSRQSVSYRDLDLARPDDVARLRKRIAAAIEDVCGSHATSESWADLDISRCRAAARARTEAQLAAILERTVRFASADSPTP